MLVNPRFFFMLKAIIQSLILILPLYHFAQNYNLTGTTKDAQGTPVAFANVVLYSQDKSKIIKGAVTNEEGFFEFNNLREATYVLVIKYLGFEDSEITIDLLKNTALSLITLVEKTEALEGGYSGLQKTNGKTFGRPFGIQC